jgi:hypothetical protein
VNNSVQESSRALLTAANVAVFVCTAMTLFEHVGRFCELGFVNKIKLTVKATRNILDVAMMYELRLCEICVM